MPTGVYERKPMTQEVKDKISKTRIERKIPGQKGEASPTWKGGRFIRHDGYVFVKKDGHPNANVNGYVREHVLVMSESLGRALEPGEIVHHINEDRGDNRLENLQLLTRAEHASHHHKGLIKPNSLKALIEHRGNRKDQDRILKNKFDDLPDAD